MVRVAEHELILLHGLPPDVEGLIARLFALHHEDAARSGSGEQRGDIRENIGAFDNEESQSGMVHYQIGACEIVSGGSAEKFEQLGVVDFDSLHAERLLSASAEGFLHGSRGMKLRMQPILGHPV